MNNYVTSTPPEMPSKDLWERGRKLRRTTLISALLTLALLGATPLNPLVVTPSAHPATSEIHDTFDENSTNVINYNETRGNWETTAGKVRTVDSTSGALLLRDTPDLGLEFSLSAEVAIGPDGVWNGILSQAGGSVGTRCEFIVLRFKKVGGTITWQLLHVTDASQGKQLLLTSGSTPSNATLGAAVVLSLSDPGTGVLSLTLTGSGTTSVSRTYEPPMASKLPGGRLGLYSLNGSLVADNVRISSSGSSVLDEFTAPAGPLSAPWTQPRGSWNLTDGGVRAIPGSELLATRPDAPLGGAFAASADITADESAYRIWSGLAVNVSTDEPSTYYVLRFTPSSSAQKSKASWQFLRHDPTPATNASVLGQGELSHPDKTFADRSPTRVTISSSGQGKISFAISQEGSVFVSSQIDLRRDNPLIGGLAGLYSTSGAASFDTFRLASSPGVPLAATDAANRPDAPTTGIKWTEAGGKWALRNGRIEWSASEKTAPENALLLTTNLTQAPDEDAVVATITPTQLARWNGIASHGATTSTSSRDFYSLEINAPQGTGTGIWRATRTTGTDRQILASGSAPITLNRGYSLSIRHEREGKIVLEIAEGTSRLALSTLVVPAANQLNDGAPGLVSYTGGAAFDDFGYFSRDQPPPPTLPFTATGNDPNPLRWSATSNPRLTPYKPTAGALAPGTSGLTLTEKTAATAPVGQALLTSGSAQYVAFYDAASRLTIGKRTLPSGDFVFHDVIDPADPQSTVFAFDAHNLIALGIDERGNLHLSANMHSNPMVYFKTLVPGDITTFQRMPDVGGIAYANVTYPTFFTKPATPGSPAKFMFAFRNGHSGIGEWEYFSWNDSRSAWEKEALLFGRGSANGVPYSSYPIQPIPTIHQGVFYFAFVWRRQDGEAYNGTRICLIKSTDFKNWTTVDGKAVPLPVNYDSPERDGLPTMIVDDPPVMGGMLNGLLGLGFDHSGDPVVTYSKFDDPTLGSGATLLEQYNSGQGSNQIFASRFEDGRWVSRQSSNWYGRWAPQGSGSIAFPLSVGSPTVWRPELGSWDATSPISSANSLLLPYSYGSGANKRTGTWILDEETLQVVAESGFRWRTGWIFTPPKTGMQWNTAWDSAGPDSEGRQWMLLWPSYPLVNDNTGSGNPPDPQDMVVYQAGP